MLLSQVQHPRWRSIPGKAADPSQEREALRVHVRLSGGCLLPDGVVCTMWGFCFNIRCVPDTGNWRWLFKRLRTHDCKIAWCCFLIIGVTWSDLKIMMLGSNWIMALYCWIFRTKKEERTVSKSNCLDNSRELVHATFIWSAEKASTAGVSEPWRLKTLPQKLC